MNVDKIELYNEEIFNNIAIDKLMKRNKNITEDKAKIILQSLYNDTNIFNNECQNEKGYSSVRHAIMYKINKI